MVMSSPLYEKSPRIVRALQRLKLMQSRNLFWSWYEPRNFGDWIGPYLFEAISGQTPFYTPVHTQKNSTCVYSAGSILRKIQYDDTVIVWGSGIISREDTFRRPKEVLSVRGPRTAEHLRRLGFPDSDVYGDPAILMPLFFKPNIEKDPRKIGIIPHFIDLEVVKGRVSDEVKVIDVTDPVETVISQIASCSATVSSSLHGVILSHAYGVPCAWIQSDNSIDGDGTKFQDYFESLGVYSVTCDVIEGEITAEKIRDAAFKAPNPSLEALQGPLLEACPFPRKRASGT